MTKSSTQTVKIDDEVDEEEQAFLIEPINLNYIWIGPPLETNKENTFPIDTHGPKEMDLAIKQYPGQYKINFWCLEAQVTHYQTQFDPSINVLSIEKFVTDMQATDSVRATKMNLIIQSLLDSARNRIRDRVTVKDLFSLFLLSARGDYTLDTNILPMKKADSSYQINLPRHDVFKVPAIHFPVRQAEDIDCWMMHAPRENPTKVYYTDSAVKKVFDAFYLQWKMKAEALFTKEGYSEAYHEALCDSMIDNIFIEAQKQLTRLLSAPLIAKRPYWRTDEFNKATGQIPIESLGIIKTLNRLASLKLAVGNI